MPQYPSAPYGRGSVIRFCLEPRPAGSGRSRLAGRMHLQVGRPIDFVGFAAIGTSDGVWGLFRDVPFARNPEPSPTGFALHGLFHGPIIHPRGSGCQPRRGTFSTGWVLAFTPGIRLRNFSNSRITAGANLSRCADHEGRGVL